MATLVLMVVLGAGAIVAVVWLLSRQQTVAGRAERTDLLGQVKARIGGTLDRVGLLRVESLTTEIGGARARIVLAQSPCPHQNRYMTHILVDGGRPSSAEVHLWTAGISPGRAFSPSGRLERVETLLATAGARLEVRAPSGPAGEKALADPGLRALLDALTDRAGLAKFELALRDTDVRFAIEGFVTDAEVLVALARLLADFAAAEPQGEASPG